MPDRVYGRQIFTALRLLIRPNRRSFAVAVGLALAAFSPEEQRSARIVFADELRAGRVLERDLDRPEVARAVAPRPIRPRACAGFSASQ